MIADYWVGELRIFINTKADLMAWLVGLGVFLPIFFTPLWAMNTRKSWRSQLATNKSGCYILLSGLGKCQALHR